MKEKETFNMSQINKQELFSFLENDIKYRKKHISTSQNQIDVAKDVLDGVWKVNELTKKDREKLIKISRNNDDFLEKSFSELFFIR